MKRCMTSLIVLVLLSCGCKLAKVRGVSSGGISWWVADEKPIPGIHKGATEVIKLLFGTPTGVTIVVWCAGASGTSSHASAGSDSAFSEGQFYLPNDRQVDFRCETNDGTTAKATIAGQTYDTSEGALFLVAVGSKEANVKQLNADVDNFPQEAAAIRDFAFGNPEIATFFKDAAVESARE